MNKYSCEETSQGLLIYCYYEDKKVSSLIEREKINQVKETMSLSGDYYLKELAKQNGISVIKRAIDKIEKQIYQLDAEKQAKEYERERVEQENKLREERQKFYQRQQELEKLKKEQEEQQRLAPLRKVESDIELIQTAIKTKEKKLAELESIHNQSTCDQSCQEELEAKRNNLAEFRKDYQELIKKKSP